MPAPSRPTPSSIRLATNAGVWAERAAQSPQQTAPAASKVPAPSRCNPGAHAARQKHRQPVTARADPACCQRFSSQRLVLFEQITRIGETRRQAEPRPVVVVSFFFAPCQRSVEGAGGESSPRSGAGPPPAGSPILG